MNRGGGNGGAGLRASSAGGLAQPLEWKFAQVFGERSAGEEVQEVDIISAIEFDRTGDHLAAGDHGGRVVLFERTDTRDHGGLHKALERMDYSINRHPEFQYKTEFRAMSQSLTILRVWKLRRKSTKSDGASQPMEHSFFFLLMTKQLNFGRSKRRR